MIDHLFKRIFQNKLLSINIFRNVKIIYSIILDNRTKSYKYKQIIGKPNVLASYNYIDLFKSYCSIFKINSTSFSKTDEIRFIKKIILSAIKSGSLAILKYIFEELNFSKQLLLDADYIDQLVWTGHDLLYYAVENGRIECIEYLFFVQGQVGVDHQWQLHRALQVVGKTNRRNNNMTILVDYIMPRFFLLSQPIEPIKIDTDYISCFEQIGRYYRKDMLDWLVKNVPREYISIDRLYLGAINGGHLEFLKYLIEIDLKSNSDYETDYWTEAVSNSRLDILQFLKDNGVGVCPEDLFDYTIKDLDLFKWVYQEYLLLGREVNFNTEWINFVALSHGFQVVKWIHENYKQIMGNYVNNVFVECFRDVMDISARLGNLEMVKWFHENRKEGCSTRAMDSAASDGNLELVKWLHDNRTEGCTTYAMDNAASHNHLDVVKWLHKNRSEGCTIKAFEQAALEGHLEMVQWLHCNRTKSNSTVTMDNAASRDHFEVVKWLNENCTDGCTQHAMDSTNSIEILQYLHENRTEGCTQYAVQFASECKNIEKLKWLKDNRTNVFETTEFLMVTLTEYDQVHMDLFNFFLNVSAKWVLLEVRTTILRDHSDSNIYIQLLNERINQLNDDYL